MIYDILCLFFHITLWVFLRLNPFVFLSVFLSFCFSVCLSVCLSFCLSVCFSLCMSVEHWHNCLNNGYNNQLDTDSNLGCLVIKLFWSIEENKKFDLTTLGFNDRKSPVPSGSLNRVPTVFTFSAFLSVAVYPALLTSPPLGNYSLPLLLIFSPFSIHSFKVS